MWAGIIALFPTIAGWINLIIGWFQKRQADQAAAGAAEGQAESQHQSDGAQSVEDKTSVDEQQAALDKLKQEIDNPTPVVVTQGDPK